MNKNFLIGLVLILLLVGGGTLLVKNSTQKSATKVIEKEEEDRALEVAKENAEDAAIVELTEKAEEEALNMQGVKTFELDAENFKFSQTEIRVKQGDKVKIVLEVDQGNHDFVIDEFNARTKQIAEGESDTVEFVADKKGAFEYYCSVGQHRQMGMVGKLIVE